MNNKVTIRLTDIVALSTDESIVRALVLEGEPNIGMEFMIPDLPGRWRIDGFGTKPAQAPVRNQPSAVYSLLTIEYGHELAVGEELSACPTTQLRA